MVPRRLAGLRERVIKRQNEAKSSQGPEFPHSPQDWTGTLQTGLVWSALDSSDPFWGWADTQAMLVLQL